MFNNRVCENIVYRIHSIFIKMIRVHIFRKHPHKLEIKSGGAISADAFYRTSKKICPKQSLQLSLKKCRLQFCVG